MRECPSCGSKFDDDALVCPLDNTRTQVFVREGLGDHLPKPGAVLGSYAITSVIGHGATGVVYLAEHKRLTRKVALKLLRPELNTDPLALRRFFDEARAIAAIQHQNIVKVTDLVEEGDFKYLVMEHLKGSTLDEIIRKEAPLPLARVLHIGRQVAAAIASAHELGIVHRDLKPQNIVLIKKDSDWDFVKVLDFGVAKMASDSTIAAKTVAGSLVGTPAYMAPEQLAEGKADARSDVYALGVLLYEMSAKMRPFSAPTLWELIPQLISDPAPRLRTVKNACRGDLPRGLDDLVDQLLKKKPDERPQTAAKVAEALYLLEREAADGPTRLAVDDDVPTTALDVIKSLGALSSDGPAVTTAGAATSPSVRPMPDVSTAPDATKGWAQDSTDPQAHADAHAAVPSTGPFQPVAVTAPHVDADATLEAARPVVPRASPLARAQARVSTLPPTYLWVASAVLLALGVAALWAVIAS